MTVQRSDRIREIKNETGSSMKMKLVIPLVAWMSLPLFIMFQNFSYRTDGLSYDEKLGQCVAEENGKKIIGAHSTNLMKPCGMLIGSSISKKQLSGLTLQGITLIGTDATEIDLLSSTLKGLTVQDVRLSKANFSGALIEQSEFYNTDISEIDFSNSHIQMSSFNRQQRNDGTEFMQGKKANFSNSQLDRVTFQSVNLKSSNFHSSRLDFGVSSENIIRSKIYHALFSQVDGSHSDFSNAVMKGSLESSDFEGGTFVSAHLSEGLLTNTSFKDSNFSGSSLTEEGICGKVDFAHANFSGVKVSELSLAGRSCRERLTELNFENADLQKSSISIKNLGPGSTVRFGGASLQGADISQLKNFKTLLVASNFKGATYDTHTKLPFDDKKAQSLGMRKVR